MDSEIARSASLYDCKIIRSKIAKECSIGDYSKVVDSELHEHVRIDRNNHIDQCELRKYTYTGKNTIVLHTNIGAFTSISWNVTIGGANHDYRRGTQHPILYNSNLGFVEKPVYDRFKTSLTIGSDVWIGAGAVILRGINISHGAVIGANCVVRADVPPYAIVVGNPGRIVKFRYPQDKIEEMLLLKWWDWSDDKIRTNINYLSDVFNKG